MPAVKIKVGPYKGEIGWLDGKASDKLSNVSVPNEKGQDVWLVLEDGEFDILSQPPIDIEEDI